MRRDPIVLGQNYILSGSDIGKKRPILRLAHLQN